MQEFETWCGNSSGLGEPRVEVAAAVDLQLQRVDAARRPRVARDDMPAGERIVKARLEP